MEARPMSDLIRYNIKPGEDGYEIAVSLGGEWVHYSDYARLQQERVHDLNQIGGLQQELARYFTLTNLGMFRSLGTRYIIYPHRPRNGQKLRNSPGTLPSPTL